MLWVAYRVYAMTEKNKLLGGTLAFLIAAHICFEIFSIIWVALRPRRSFFFFSFVHESIGS